MSSSTDEATFERLTEIETDDTTLIEGLPGLGLVAAIAVDRITDQLGLTHHGSITSKAFPPVVTFDDGLVQDLVRVYASEEPAVMTLQSDLALPQASFPALSKCVLSDLSNSFDRAIFLAGAPAQSEEELGAVAGIATTPELRDELSEVGVTIPEEHGVVGGITGALVRECYRSDIPATLLIVRSHPYLPDPGAARSVIENAIEPLVDFDIDTAVLEDQAEEIRRQMQQIAEQYQQVAGEPEERRGPGMSMYQ